MRAGSQIQGRQRGRQKEDLLKVFGGSCHFHMAAPSPRGVTGPLHGNTALCRQSAAFLPIGGCSSHWALRYGTQDKGRLTNALLLPALPREAPTGTGWSHAGRVVLCRWLQAVDLVPLLDRLSSSIQTGSFLPANAKNLFLFSHFSHKITAGEVKKHSFKCIFSLSSFTSGTCGYNWYCRMSYFCLCFYFPAPLDTHPHAL